MHAKLAGMCTHAGMRLWPVQGSAAVAGVPTNACQTSWNMHTRRLRLWTSAGVSSTCIGCQLMHAK